MTSVGALIFGSSGVRSVVTTAALAVELARKHAEQENALEAIEEAGPIAWTGHVEPKS